MKPTLQFVKQFNSYHGRVTVVSTFQNVNSSPKYGLEFIFDDVDWDFRLERFYDSKLSRDKVFNKLNIDDINAIANCGYQLYKIERDDLHNQKTVQ